MSSVRPSVRFRLASSVAEFSWGCLVSFSGRGRVAAAALFRRSCGVAVVVAGAGVVVVAFPAEGVALPAFRSGLLGWLASRVWLRPCPGLSAGLRC